MNGTKTYILVFVIAIVFGIFAYLSNRPGSYFSHEECLQHATEEQFCTKKLFKWIIIVVD
jgi:hypothetical protein